MNTPIYWLPLYKEHSRNRKLPAATQTACFNIVLFDRIKCTRSNAKELRSCFFGAAKVVAGVSGIPALHHLHLVCVCFRVWVPYSANVLQNWPIESLVGPFLDRCWCSAEIPLEEGTSVVGLLGCLVDVLRPCTLLVESHSKVYCCVSHLQYIPVDVVLGDDWRWLPCDSH